MGTVAPSPQFDPPFAGQTLFSDNFLAERLPARPCWTDDDLPELHRRLVDAYHTFREVRKDQDVQPLSDKHESIRPKK